MFRMFKVLAVSTMVVLSGASALADTTVEAAPAQTSPEVQKDESANGTSDDLGVTAGCYFGPYGYVCAPECRLVTECNPWGCWTREVCY